MSRRRTLQALLGVGGWLAFTGHSPYRQWELYRKTRLIILSAISDDQSARLAAATAQLLADHLPTSKATYARARAFTDIVRLLNSKQHDMALLREVDAKEGLAGSGRFEEDGPTPLRALARIGPYLLVCRDDFQASHAYMIVEALTQNWSAFPAGLVAPAKGPRADQAVIPLHPGAIEYYSGQPQ